MGVSINAEQIKIDRSHSTEKERRRSTPTLNVEDDVELKLDWKLESSIQDPIQVWIKTGSQRSKGDGLISAIHVFNLPKWRKHQNRLNYSPRVLQLVKVPE
ncbi:hypothetical protein NE237_004695 [Protea cynaroides]|uniref:Uncharacterized protein n=1 Tax=Protea cynaroides TaxID=273540 RepID=A0A9Q0KJW7_9MAGN|nr:hypothetical protein NE237_004695 [Protea cynaroides]